MIREGFYYEHNKCMLIAIIEIALSKNGKADVSCIVYTTCILCIVVNHKLKRDLQRINLSKNMILEMRSSNMNDIISYVNTCLTFKYYSVFCQSKWNNFVKSMLAYLTRVFNNYVIS